MKKLSPALVILALVAVGTTFWVLRWGFQDESLPPPPEPLPLESGALGSPAIATDGSLYVTTDLGKLVKVRIDHDNRSLEREWVFPDEPNKPFFVTSAPAVTELTAAYVAGVNSKGLVELHKVSFTGRFGERVLTPEWDTKLTTGKDRGGFDEEVRQGEFRTGPIVDHAPNPETVYFSTISRLCAVSAGNGARKHCYQVLHAKWTAASVGPDYIFVSDQIFVSGKDPQVMPWRLTALSKSAPYQTFTIEAFTNTPAAPAPPVAFPAQALPPRKNAFLALTYSGRTLSAWSLENGQWKKHAAPSISAVAPARSLAVGARLAYVVGIDRVAVLKWDSKLAVSCVAQGMGDILTGLATNSDPKSLAYVGTTAGLWEIDGTRQTRGNCEIRFISPRRVDADPLLGDDGTVYFSSRDTLVAIDPRDPSRKPTAKWTVPYEGARYGSTSALGTDFSFFITTSDHRLLALSRLAGWEIESYGPRDIQLTTDAATLNRTTTFSENGSAGKTIHWNSIFAAGVESTLDPNRKMTPQPKLYAIRADGELKWSAELDGEPLGPPAVGGSSIVMVARNALHEFTFAGKKVREEEPRGEFTSAPSIGPDGMIHVGCQHESKPHLCSFSTKRKPRWSYLPTAGTVEHAPAIDKDGSLWVASASDSPEEIKEYVGTLYHLELGWLPDTKTWGLRELRSWLLDAALGGLGMTPKIAGTSSPVIGADGVVWLPTKGFDTRGKGKDFYALSAMHPTDKEVRECLELGPVESPPAIGSDGRAYFSTQRTENDSFGPTLWSLEDSPGEIEKWQPTTNRDVVCGGYAVLHEPGPQSFTSPIIDRDYRPQDQENKRVVLILAGATDGRLHAVWRNYPDKGPGGLADSAWPMYRRDQDHSASAQVCRARVGCDCTGIIDWVHVSATTCAELSPERQLEACVAGNTCVDDWQLGGGCFDVC